MTDAATSQDLLESEDTSSNPSNNTVDADAAPLNAVDSMQEERADQPGDLAAAAEPAAEAVRVPSAADSSPLCAFVLMQCASCRIANEVAIPIGSERTFVVQCHECRERNELTIDTNDATLIVAKGLPEWSVPPPPPPPPPPPSAAVPPKKRKALATASVVAANDAEQPEGLPSTAEGKPRVVTAAGKSKGKKGQATAAAATDTAAPATKAPHAKPNGKPSKAAKTAKAVKAEAAPAKPSKPQKGKSSAAQASVGAHGGGGGGSGGTSAAALAAPVRVATVKRGSVAIALFGDGYYYTGVVDAMREGETPHDSAFLIAWDDGDEPAWVGSADTVLAYRQPMASELYPGMPVLALYEGVCSTEQGQQEEGAEEEQTEVWFPAKVVGCAETPPPLGGSGGSGDGGASPSPPSPSADPSSSTTDAVAAAALPPPPADAFELEWDEGKEHFTAGCHELRTFLASTPHKIRYEKPKERKKRERYADDDEALARMLAAEEAGYVERDESVAADLLRRSGRDNQIHKADPSDLKLLREALAELKRVWSGPEPSGAWKLERDARGVEGLLVIENFLDDAEVEALRTVMGAHRAWHHYAYGSVGRHGELDSVVQRIDFGPGAMRAEGVVGGAPMWRLGPMRAEMLSMVGERLRSVCRAAGLWGATRPDTLQLTRIGCAHKIANHWDRRDRWQEGIASIAWSELPCESDLRGGPWTLVMERGTKKDLESRHITLPPGSAYVLTGAAQGCTKACERGCVGHNRCNCCWTHGVLVDPDSIAARQSMTLRVLADSDDESEEEEEAAERPQREPSAAEEPPAAAEPSVQDERVAPEVAAAAEGPRRVEDDVEGNASEGREEPTALQAEAMILEEGTSASEVAGGARRAGGGAN